MDLLERIDRWGRSTPDRLAHVSEGRQITYGELLGRSDALAAHLADVLTPRVPVAVLGHKEPEVLIAFLGAVKSGHPYVPIDTIVPPHRVERIVQTAGAETTLTPARVAEISAYETTRSAQRNLQPRLASSDPFYIMFTSGSTGEPKGVVITLGCLTSYVQWMLAEHAFEPAGEVFLNQVPYNFDVSVMDSYLGLLTGGTIFSITRHLVANPKQLYRALARSGVTTWVSTPSFAQFCLAERTFDAAMLQGVRRFLFCGETLAPEAATELLDRFPEAEVWNTYGPTEATVATTSIRIDREIVERYSPLPIGYAMPGTQLLIRDEAGQLVSPGERGEIVIVGPNVSPGYLGRADLTERAFFELDGQRAYRTGDWGRQRDGLFFFEGRMDSQIKLHGYRVELGDVEAHLRALPGVRDAVVLPVVKHGRAQSLTAFVILADKPAQSEFEVWSALRAGLAERVPVYMLPRKFHFLETFPMTPNGKADRRKLAESLA